MFSFTIKCCFLYLINFLFLINIHIPDYPDYFVSFQRVRIIEVQLYLFIFNAALRKRNGNKFS